MSASRFAIVSALLIAAGPPVVAASDPLVSYAWRSRVLVVVSPDRADPRLARQKRLLTVAGAGAKDRDLVVVEAVAPAPEAAALRRRFGLGERDFAVILVGKDGGEKLRAGEPVRADRLFATIDEMPMRRGEMRRQTSR